MHRRSFVASALFAGLPSLVTTARAQTAHPAPMVTQPQVVDPSRILFVGNSYYYYNNSLHNHLGGLVDADRAVPRRERQYKSATIGGSTLDHHPIEWLTEPGRIGVKQAFEVVVLAGNSADGLSDTTRAAFRAAVRRFSEVIASRGGKTALYMTPAYVAPHRQVDADNLRKIADMYVSVGNEVNALVIPVGLAFEEAYRRHPSLRLHDAYDGSHPSLGGTYLAACTAYASLYGRSPVGNAYNYFGAIEPALAQQLQQAAHDTARKFFGR